MKQIEVLRKTLLSKVLKLTRKQITKSKQEKIIDKAYNTKSKNHLTELIEQITSLNEGEKVKSVRKKKQIENTKKFQEKQKQKRVVKKQHKLVVCHVILYEAYHDESEIKRRHQRIEGVKYTVFKNVNLNVRDEKLMDFYNTKKTYLRTDAEGKENEDFETIVKMFMTDNDFERTPTAHIFRMYIEAFKIIDAKIITTDKIPRRTYEEIVHDEVEQDMNNSFKKKTIYNQYVKSVFNTETTDINKIIKVEEPIENSCFINCILTTFKESFDSKFKNKKLTLEYLLNLFGMEKHQKQDIGLSINRSLIFFEKYNIALDVINEENKMIFQYIPEKEPNFKPRKLRILKKGNHCYIINNNIKQFDQIELNNIDNNHEIIIGDKYMTFDKKEDNDDEIIPHKMIIYNIEEIIEIQKKNNTDSQKYFQLFTNMNMNFVLYKIYKNMGICPQVKCNGFVVNNVKFNLGNNTYSIQSLTMGNNGDRDITFDSLEEYEKYNDLNKQVLRQTLINQYKSTYNDDDLVLENQYSIKPINKRFQDIYNEKVKYNTLDFNKFYTSILEQITHIPVFNTFDTFKKYQGEQIQDLTFYIIKILDKSNGSKLMFENTYNRTFGFVLKNIQYKYEIIAYKKPSHIQPINFKKIVKDIYNETISNNEQTDKQLKKNIFNILTGKFELKYNRRSRSFLFDNEDEALQHYNECQRAKIHRIFIQGTSPINFYQDSDDEDGYTGTQYETINDNLFVVETIGEKQLKDGFKYIKDIIYSYSNLKLINLYEEMAKNNIEVVALKTDCCLFDAKYEMKVKSIFKNIINDKRGNLKMEYDKKSCGSFVIRSHNEYPTIIDRIPNEIILEDEWNLNEFKEKLLNLSIVNGDIGGAGKSTGVLYATQGMKRLIIAPYNKLVQEIQQDNITDKNTTTQTLYTAFNINMNTKEQSTYELDFEVIIFDEIYLYSPTELSIIKKVMLNYPNIKYYATGDVYQLEAINFYQNNIKDKIAYIRECVYQLFQNEIILHDNKRCKTPEDQAKVKQIKQDILFNKLPIEDICIKYGLKTIRGLHELQDKNAICYFNFRNKMINTIINKRILKNKQMYFIGQSIKCCQRLKIKSQKCHTNYTYTITDLTTKTFSIKDLTTGEMIENIDIKFLDKHFMLAYCNTCHSVQGLSIKDNITIFDCNTPYVSRNFIYTAITRARELSKITIFIHPKEEVEKLLKSKLLQYFDFKIKNYIEQDKQAGREISEDYIQSMDIYNLLENNNNCSHCRKTFNFYTDNGITRGNLTLQRINNDIAHTKANCILLCRRCRILNI